jgi:HlyD family secretion protein
MMPSRRRSRWLGPLLLLLAAAVAACARQPNHLPAVGTLERDRIELIAEQQEPILEIPVVEGMRVEAGDLVVSLDDSRAAAELAAAAAARDAAAARLAELIRGTRREEIEEARARLREAESAVAEALPEVARVRSLVDQGIDSRRSLEQAQAALGEAEGRRDATRSTLTRLLNGATPEELDQATAVLTEAEARVDEVRLRKERLQVRAPRPAVVDALPYEVGERPPPGATVAVLLAGGAPYARIYVPARIRPGIGEGSLASVRVEGVEQIFAGRLRWVANEAAFTPFFALTERDRGRLAYVAEVDLTEPEAAALPTGLPVEVAFDTAPAAGASGEG